MTASKGQNGVGSTDSPKHAGLLETGADYSLATCLDDTRADKQMLTAKPRIPHSLRVPGKVVGFDANLLCQFGVGGSDGAHPLAFRSSPCRAAVFDGLSPRLFGWFRHWDAACVLSPKGADERDRDRQSERHWENAV